MVGTNGGGAFVLLYILCLIVLGMPAMTMEFAMGRAAQASPVRMYHKLEKKGQKWHLHGYLCLLGCCMLMMYYTTVSGWMLSYFVKFLTGTFSGLNGDAVSGVFGQMLASPGEMGGYMALTVVLGFAICSFGLQNGVERITKAMMLALLAILGVLVVRALTLPGAADGVAFYLLPDFSKIFGSPDMFFEAAYAAMGQAFFTLSIGMGSMTIFGSYIDKHRSLMGEAATIGVLDTGVALATGLIIFPACFAFGVAPDSGPGLVFITLPSVFEQMWGGQVWGTLFFVFMSFAALSTVIAVFEGILRFSMDQWGWSRKRAVTVNLIAIPLLSLPCALGFNVLSDVVMPGVGDIQTVEDFLVSSNIMPLGSLVYVLFCVSRRGWGWKNFLAEANEGEGLKFPRWLRPWMRFGVPVLVVIILIMGWVPIVSSWM